MRMRMKGYHKTTGRWKSEKTAGYKAVAAVEDGHAPDFEDTRKSADVHKNGDAAVRTVA
jgi:hypothetical protein